VSRWWGLGWTIVLVGALLVGALGLASLFRDAAIDRLFVGFDGLSVLPTSGSLLAAGVATATSLPTSTPVPLVVVPDLANLTEEEARATLIQAGLVPVAGAPGASDTVAEGMVIGQAVPGSTSIPQGSPLTYTLSLGPGLASVPDLALQQLDHARQVLQELGLAVEVVEQPSQTIGEGLVIGQEPGVGARIQRGSGVLLVVSVGDKVRVPDLIGKTEQEARAILAQTGGALVWGSSDYQGRARLGELFDQVAAGVVVSTLPERNSWAPRGTAVVLGVRAAE
jgi:serine/threonine-protein kinase